MTNQTKTGGLQISIQAWARLTAFLLLFSIVGGGFGEAYAPSKFIVSGDPAATANNVMTFTSLFRAGFAGYLVEAFCDIGLAFTFYVLLRAVQKDLALLAAFFGLVSTAVYAVAQIFYFAALIILRSRDALAMFSPEQINGLAFLSLRISGNIGWIFLALYGIPTILRGYLIFRSGYLPKFLGVLLIVAGTGFILKDFTTVLVPVYASDILLLPMFLALIALTIWFFVKGVDLGKWEQTARLT
jgi:Domain of unknown function (DUF4386)